MDTITRKTVKHVKKAIRRNIWNKTADGVITCAYRQAYALKVIMMVKECSKITDKLIAMQLQTPQYDSGLVLIAVGFILNLPEAESLKAAFLGNYCHVSVSLVKLMLNNF